MAKKKKKKTTHQPAAPKKKKKKVIAQPQCKYDNLMLDSDFLKALYDQFFDAQEKPTWPGDPAETRDVRALQQIPEAFNALLTRQISGGQLAQAHGVDRTALSLVNKAAATSGWPGANSGIPDGWKADAATYRLFEVAWAVNIMVQAYTLVGAGGGGPDDWPSGGHHP